MVRIDVKSELLASAPFPRLKDKKILFMITGSVAAYRMVDVVRELIRLGANVHVMMSPDSLSLITPETFEWATGNKVITEITGNIEHVLYAGAHEDHVNLIIIAPATANTISKVALGIADTNVALTATVAIGNNIPLLVVPGMHAPMFNNPMLRKRINELENIPNCVILPPRIEDGKAKVPSNETIIQNVIRILTPQKLKSKHVLVSGGATREFIDRVRFISNPASGKTAKFLALEAWFQGATVDLIMGNSDDFDFPFTYYNVTSTEDMYNKIKEKITKFKHAIVILTAAVSDYKPINYTDGKIRSGEEKFQINLEPTVKIIKKIKSINKNCVLVGFKAEHHPNEDLLREIFDEYKTQSNIDVLVANDISEVGSGFGTDKNHIWILTSSKMKEYLDHKEKLAEIILNEALEFKG